MCVSVPHIYDHITETAIEIHDWSSRISTISAVDLLYHSIKGSPDSRPEPIGKFGSEESGKSQAMLRLKRRALQR
jgi:hypothetical protein